MQAKSRSVKNTCSSSFYRSLSESVSPVALESAFSTSLLSSSALLDLLPGQVQDLVRLLLATVPRYLDSTSRKVVLQVLASLLATERQVQAAAGDAAQKKGVTAGLIKWLEMEVEKSEKNGTVAVDTRYVLLGWALTLYGSIDETLEAGQWTSLVNSLAVLIDALVDEKALAKVSLRKAVIKMTRRAIRSVSRLSLLLLIVKVLTAWQFIEFFDHSCPRQDTRYHQARACLSGGPTHGHRIRYDLPFARQFGSQGRWIAPHRAAQGRFNLFSSCFKTLAELSWLI